MANALTSPDKFFEARMKAEESLKIPLLIVLISGIISGIAPISMVGITFEPSEALSLVATRGISAFIGDLVRAFIIWVVFATTFYGMSWMLKGEGTFKRTLEFVGYGFIPAIFNKIVIRAVLTYDFISMAEISIFQLNIIAILFMLWSASIWIFGLKHARNLSTKNALITVGIPVAAYVLYLVWQFGMM